MKGMVFTELSSFVEQIRGADAVDDLVDACDSPSGGAYTAVGTCGHTEMQALVAALSRQSNTPPNELLEVFGCGPLPFAISPGTLARGRAGHHRGHEQTHQLSPATASPIGIARFPQDAADSTDLQADVALYRSKAAGRSMWTAFDETMVAELRSRHGLEANLRSAVTDGSVEPWYLSETGSIVRVEGLA
jgi:hypothetical protein